MSRSFFALFALVAIGSLALAAPRPRAHVGARYSVPDHWQKLTESIAFVVALPQQKLALLQKLYDDRTNPESPRWREWLQPEEINEIVAPPKAVHDRVWTWLEEHGARHLQSRGDAIAGVATVQDLSVMFETTFHVFKHTSGAHLIRAWGAVTVPEELTEDVVLVEGLTNFPVKYSPKRRPSQHKRGLWDWDSYIVPGTLWQQYNIPPDTRATGNGSQAVIEWEQQSFSPQDLVTFAKLMGVPNVSVPSKDKVIGPNNPNAAGTESTLDIEWISATGLNVTNWFWLNGGEAWLYSWATQFINTKVVPLVVSLSYGWSEADQCAQGIGGRECDKIKATSRTYVERVNNEFMKIGLRGVTIVVASGDSGANGRTDELCTEGHFNPDFPAASPYVTSVGATQLRDVSFDLPTPPPVCNADWWYCAGSGTEQAVSYEFAGFASGGGFSNVAAQPSWQKDAVKAYLGTAEGQKAPSAYFNSSGRAYPDVSALGSAILIIIGGADASVGGTSASAPIVAGVFSLLNDEVLKKSNKPLGPMNPLLYKMAAEMPEAFIDVVEGDNSCTESGCALGYCKGYYCAKGWDPVTGLGSPNYTKMLQYVQALLH